jgi:hypothetical protein
MNQYATCIAGHRDLVGSSPKRRELCPILAVPHGYRLIQISLWRGISRIYPGKSQYLGTAHSNIRKAPTKWRWIQSGANRDFAGVLQKMPWHYPSILRNPRDFSRLPSY